MTDTEIQIDAEFKSLIPPLTPEEYAQLEQNILDEGCRDSLVVWVDKTDCPECGETCLCEGDVPCPHCGAFFEYPAPVLIDGHNRYEICTKHGIGFDTVELYRDTRDGVKAWIIQNQFGRRNLPLYVRAELALVLEPLYRDKAKENQGERTDICQTSDKCSKSIDTKKELAKLAGVSHDTIMRAKKISEKADEATKAKLRTGELTINKAYKDVVKQERKEEVERIKVEAQKKVIDLPDDDKIVILNRDAFELMADMDGGVFDCIVTDPPYNVTQHDWDKFEDDKNYMQFVSKLVSECKRLLKPDYSFFMFADPEYMADVEMVIRNSGFKLKSRIVWVRKNMSMGRQVADRFISQWEPCFYCGTRELNFPAEWGDERGDVQTFAVPQSNFKDKKIHPTQKPIELIRRFVELGSEVGDRVFDPFCGAGTTALACKSLNRLCTTCDTDGAYVALAKERVFNGV